MAINETVHSSEPLAPNKDPYFQTEHLKVDLGGRTIRGGAVTLVTQALKFLIGMIGTVILARLLTPQDYGLVGMVAVIIGFVSIFKDLGLSTATIQRAEISADQVSTLFWINSGLSVVVMFVCVGIAPIVALFYKEPRLRLITAVYGVGFLLGGLTVQHEALLRRQMRFTALAVAELLALCASVATAIILAWHGAGYWALVSSQLGLGLVYLICTWTLCAWRPGLPSRHSGVRSMLAFGGNLTGFGVINYFARNLDNMLIGRFWGSQQLGLYAKAYQLLLLPIEQINGPIGAVALPALSRLADSPERYRQAYLRIIQKVALVTMPGVALMIVTSDWIVRIVLGPQWTQAAPIFALLGIAGLIQPIASTTGLLFITQNRTRHMFQWGLIGPTIIVLSIVAGLPWGAVGVATSYSVTFVCVVSPLLFWFVGRHGPVRLIDFYRALAPFSVLSVLSIAACLAFRRWGPTTAPLLGIILCLLIVLPITLVTLTASARGRLVLSDVKASILILLRRTGNRPWNRK